MRPAFSITNKRPEPSGCRSTGRSRFAIGNCSHAYAFGSGNVVVLVGASIEGIELGVEVEASPVAGKVVSVMEIAVGGSADGMEVGVFTPLQAATASTRKAINFFIYR